MDLCRCEQEEGEREAEGELPPLLDPFSLSCLAAGNLFLAASLSRGAAINVKRRAL